MTRSLSAAVAIILAALAFAATAHAESHEEAAEKSPGLVTVTGTGKVNAAPDMANIRSGVVSEAPTAAEALANNTDAMEKVMRELSRLGIAEKDIQTSRFSVDPIRTRPREGNEAPRITGYRVTNMVAIKIRDLELLGRALDALVQAGANEMGGIQFDLAYRTKVLDEARIAAVKDARRKAELYAGAADVALGRVLTIAEGHVASPVRMEARAMSMMAADVPVSAGELELSASVTITYEIAE